MALLTGRADGVRSVMGVEWWAGRDMGMRFDIRSTHSLLVSPHAAPVYTDRIARLHSMIAFRIVACIHRKAGLD